MESQIRLTGFTTSAQAQQAAYWGEEMIVGIGVLASDVTIRGGIDQRYPRRYPPALEIAGIFVESASALNLVHFHTRTRVGLFDELQRVTELAGENCHGIQVNQTWPEAKALARFKARYPDKKIILPVTQPAIIEAGDQLTALVGRIADYEGLIDAILLDGSGGGGKKFNPDYTTRVLNATRRNCPGLGLGVAGGLGPGEMDHLRPVAKAIPNLSIDAEGKLRDSQDDLDLDRCRRYFEEALTILSGK